MLYYSVVAIADTTVTVLSIVAFVLLAIVVIPFILLHITHPERDTSSIIFVARSRPKLLQLQPGRCHKADSFMRSLW